jgi:GntR family transcriptional regulator/MocR family aminotransferase
MRIPIDRDSDLPLYRQIETFLRQGILSGKLAPGTRLPATRRLAQDLGLNRITVETAYAELEADGLIAARVGSGTYVLEPYAVPSTHTEERGQPWPLWQEEIGARSRAWQATSLQDTLPASRHPRPIDLSDGTGDPALFPAQEFRKIIQAVMRRDGVAALEYGDRAGYAPLRNTIAHVLASQGLQASPETILITSGSQQALALISHLLLRPGDTVVTERPTYAGALGLFRTMGVQLVTVATDEQGLQVEHLETVLQQHHPRLIYCMPTFQNPTGRGGHNIR